MLKSRRVKKSKKGKDAEEEKPSRNMFKMRWKLNYIININ